MTSIDMREPTFIVLTVLAEGRQHGYGLIREAELISNGRVRLKPGTLYATLDRLAHEGLVAEDGEEVVDGRFRRYYTITDQGATVLESEAERLAGNAELARRRLARRAPRTGLGVVGFAR